MLVIYVLAASSRRSVAIGTVLLLIPFQTVDTRYATSSVLVAYALAAVLLLNGGLRVRMLPSLGIVALAYLVSLSQADRELMSLHVIFIFQFFSCLVVFLLAYNFARVIESERSVVDLLLAMNVLAIIYCLLQVLAGSNETFMPFGIDALAFNKNRLGSDARLVGPFDNPGSTAGYFTIMILVCAVELMFARGWRKTLVQALVLANLVGLVATGNRAGLLVLVAMFPVLLFVFRQQLGVRRASQYLASGVLIFALASAAAINYTGFARMFERMEQVTETENGVPTTRAVTWPIAIEKIKEHPFVGEGPFFIDPATAEGLGWPPSKMTPYPHSLYLYLLRTVGVAGLLAVLWFFIEVWRIGRRSLANGRLAEYPAALVRLGLIIIPAFLLAQVTLEFNRPATIDYAQFIFALMGLIVGLSDRVGQGSSTPVGERSSQVGAAYDVPPGQLNAGRS
ncbi:MAG: O-antigen ligase family protein [Steroidobacteraceae bacterium]|nr:O-antigen ligase family protein [Steroidobacteraceae bacterium]